ncbi:MAG TPA: creatininase family protein [Planctomycetota bacterium]|nr:creatininase family protein [Planctomycetota bacterium]
MTRLADLPWPEAERAAGGPFLALLPVGSTEAHGPHLPLSTDTLLAEGMADAAAALLRARGRRVLVLPPLPYGVTECAGEFFGTLSVSARTVESLVVDVAASLRARGCARLGLVNAHLEPANRHALRAAAQAASAAGLPTVLPDVVRRVYAERLGAEFRSGACHAGDFEGSLVLALRPELVREGVRVALPENPTSLGAALAAGKQKFKEAGGPQAYFGAPAAASAETGRALLRELATIVADEMEGPA